MKKKDPFTKTLAIAGTVLAWIPILAPILFTVILLAAEQIFRFDYLMPAEFFLFALVGGGFLIWAAIRAHSHLKWVAWSLGAAVFFLLGTQGLAVVTGLAHGDTEPVGLPWLIVIGALGLFTLSLIALGVGGILLLRDLFGTSKPAVV